MNWNEFITKAFEEDLQEGDHTSLACVPETATGNARLIAKQNGILAGVELAQLIFKQFDSSLKVNVMMNDGDQIKPGDSILTVEGKDQSILTAERLVLNCMQRMSGVATLTKKYVDAVAGTGVRILDTRKTTPLFRAAEKWAVRIGGGVNHRFGLYDMILIKDNHIDFAGSVTKAVETANAYRKAKHLNIPIEVEVRDISELNELLNCDGVQRVMFDNFSVKQVAEAVKVVNGKIETEVSGGINLETIRGYALAHPDFISVGALTHSYVSLDLSLKAMK